MQLFWIAIASFILFFNSSVFANPYWDPLKVPNELSYTNLNFKEMEINPRTVKNDTGIDVLRIQVDWQEKNETYTVSNIVIEASGTPALIARSHHQPHLGSYLGVLVDQKGHALFYDSIGTGKEYRKLARAISLRFPIPKQDVTFELYAENPSSGLMEKVVSKTISISELTKKSTNIADVEVKELAVASQTPTLRINIYAEGYLANEKQSFWQHAMKAVKALKNERFPGVEHMSFYGVFHASNKKLGSARNLGLPIPEYDSFLGLYFPYWDKFGRWYNIIYPTREHKLRQGLGSAPYDYAIVLVNDSGYWGVGNYKAFTAIPAENSFYFTYLLFHEFGHFFGLNEEYNDGGRTELEFAKGISEPWSQNITFFRENNYEKLKWKKFVDSRIKLPTPNSVWHNTPPVYGAYEGGYAESPITDGSSYKPGLSCVMDRAPHFCAICAKAIEEMVQDNLDGKVFQ